MSDVSRRSFLKFSAMTGLAAAMPVGLVFDYQDAETRMVDFIMTHYDDELIVIELIKNYCWSDGGSSFPMKIRQFGQRQNHLLGWLRSRIVIDRNNRKSNNERYEKVKADRDFAAEIKIAGLNEWNNVVAPKFGFKQAKQLF